MQKARAITVTILAVLIAIYAIIQYGFFGPGMSGIGQFKLESPDFTLYPWAYVLYAHIITAVVAIVIGPFQIFRKQKSPASQKMHRQLGMLYVVCIGISGIVSVYLSLYASGGPIARTGFFALDLFWMYSTYMAVHTIMKHDVRAHRKWILRSYALTFAAVTLRVYMVPLVMLTGQFETAYQIVAWLCWVPNLILIELFLRKKKTLAR
ncbi:DUF2306 domain-containing protein [Paenibacillus sp. N1-5-1-14]|uniref:DUF2306 domain-containing protein n=1 Tax=Paenibacillus radicibacter TaxID=2972488 RepID=UPI0021595856|nr:DUF2306 domain-containing protein [Paenibacillus radicibacter]MCR8642871.1 DUF2306 domain-containing protein [Paenibacillus radicibacter]